MARRTTPLGSYAALRTTNVDVARASVSASLAPHELTVLGESDRFAAVHNAAELEGLSLHYIDYGAEVEVRAERLDFYLIQVPIDGACMIRTGVRTVTATPRNAAVITPGEAVRMRYSAGNRRLMVRISRDLLRERLEVADAGGLTVAVEDVARFDMTGGAGRSWRTLVELIVSDLERDGGLVTAPLAAQSLQVAVVDGLIVSLAGQHQDAAPERSALERRVRRATRLIDEHCAEPLGTPDVAEAVGLSVRALQAGFRTHLDTTPMAYLRQARLARVRESLSDVNAQSVTEVARAWGITHLGRLSVEYRAAFGESPHETLRQGR